MFLPDAPVMNPGEEVIASWLANRTQSSQRAVGGKLWLTNQRLIFTPHSLDRSLDGRGCEYSLKDIRDVGTANVNLLHFFGGGLRRRVKITLEDRAEFFVINRRARVITEIKRAAGLGPLPH